MLRMKDQHGFLGGSLLVYIPGSPTRCGQSSGTPHSCNTFVACRDFSALPSLLEVLTPPGEARPRDLSSSRGPGVSFFRPLRIDI